VVEGFHLESLHAATDAKTEKERSPEALSASFKRRVKCYWQGKGYGHHPKPSAIVAV